MHSGLIVVLRDLTPQHPQASSLQSFSFAASSPKSLLELSTHLQHELEGRFALYFTSALQGTY
jgi:hypothetical protein